MGATMGGHLLDAGTPLVVYDPSAEARRPLVEHGAREAASAAEAAAQSDLVLAVVVDDVQVREALTDAFAGARPGPVLAVRASGRADPRRALEAAGRRLGLPA